MVPAIKSLPFSLRRRKYLSMSRYSFVKVPIYGDRKLKWFLARFAGWGGVELPRNETRPANQGVKNERTCD